MKVYYSCNLSFIISLDILIDFASDIFKPGTLGTKLYNFDILHSNQVNLNLSSTDLYGDSLYY